MSVSPKIGLYDDVIVVERGKFEEMVISLVQGFGDRFTTNAMPSHLMRLFGVETRQEAVDIIHQMQEHHRKRAEDANRS
jgi:hypothetical protein